MLVAVLVKSIRPKAILIALAFALAIGGCDATGISTIPTIVPTSISVPIATATEAPTSIPTIPPIPTPIPFDTPVLGPSTFTGTYLADARPTDIDFMYLVQSGNSLSGYITFIKPVGESTNSQTVSLTGTADGDTFFLSKSSFLENIQFSGRRVAGNQIILSWPSQSGEIGYRTMVPATQEQFNNLLYEWQGILSHRGGPYLGVSTIPVTNMFSNFDDIKDKDGNFLKIGVWIEFIVGGSAADEAGLRVGDVILDIDGVVLDADHSLTYVLNDYLHLQPGDTVTLTIYRKGKAMVLTATLGARP